MKQNKTDRHCPLKEMKTCFQLATVKLNQINILVKTVRFFVFKKDSISRIE
uniref:Uncharacterized protein n=1 Tax=Anguilla anguilla TaxID=7936 RepID=A0A0E9TVZ6_ANGAN